MCIFYSERKIALTTLINILTPLSHSSQTPPTMNILIDFLPIDICNSILDFTGETENWKHRFSTDVLVEINHGWRWVGIGCDEHFWQSCDCDKNTFTYCANCFSYGTDLCNHDTWEHVSFKQVIQQGSHPDVGAQPYLHWEVFSYFHNADLFSDRINILTAFRMQLTARMEVQRILVEDFDESEATFDDWFEMEVRPYGYALESVLGTQDSNDFYESDYGDYDDSDDNYNETVEDYDDSEW